MENEKELEGRAATLVEEVRLIPIDFLVDPHHEPPVAKTPKDLVEIFQRKKRHLADYYKGKLSEIAYRLAMDSSFGSKTIDLRNMDPQDAANYGHALDHWRNHLDKFQLEEIPEKLEEAIARHSREKSPESHEACLGIVRDICQVDEATARVLVPA